MNFVGPFVILLLAAFVTHAVSRGRGTLRSLYWAAFAEYVLCACLQLYYSRVWGLGDQLSYAQSGDMIARYLDDNFAWASHEAFALLAQRPSRFDQLIDGAGSNTGSMIGAATWLVWLLRSQYGAHFAVTVGAMFASFGVFAALSDVESHISKRRIFLATVLFPSVAFWTSALHKESFGLMGMALLLAGWRAFARSNYVRALVYSGVGIAAVMLFRTFVLPPVVLGIGIFMLARRLQQARGGEGLLVGPVYFAIGLALMALTMAVISAVAPKFGIDRISETMTSMQRGWAYSRDVGGSDIIAEEDFGDVTLGGELAHVPSALVNSLFRPTLLDVHNGPSLVGAIEMTTLTVLLLVVLRRRGIRGTMTAIQRSPLLMMCLAITVIGCTFVGIVTLNLGSLSRYRVPFLPFYGVLVAGLVADPAAERVRAKPTAQPGRTLSGPKRRGRQAAVPRLS